MNITDIPKVRVYDGAGKTYSEGYYFEMPSYMGPGIYDGAPPKIPLSRCLVHYYQGDWNLPNYPMLSRVTPPHRFEVIATEKMHWMASDVRNAAALFSQGYRARCDRLREIADFLDCRDAQAYDASGEKEDEDARVGLERKAAEKRNGGSAERDSVLKKLKEMGEWIENWNGADTIEWDSIADAIESAKKFIERGGAK